MGLSSPRLFQKVILPAAVPTIFTGIRLAGAVVDPRPDRRRDGRRQGRARLPDQLLAVQLPDPRDVRRHRHDLGDRRGLQLRAGPDRAPALPLEDTDGRAAAPQRLPRCAPATTRPPGATRDPAGADQRRRLLPPRLARTAERGVRLGLLRRRPGALPATSRYNAVGGFEPLTLLAAHRRGDRAHRADRDRLDHLQRALQPGPDVRLARPPERRPGRLEHRHLRARTSPAAQLRPRRPPRPGGPLRARATEFLDVVTKLWDSWEDDAILLDRAAGRYADTDRIHPADHGGPHFRVRGPLNVPRSPQGRPLLVQAGSSDDGKDVRRPVRRGRLHRPAAARRRSGVLRRHQVPARRGSAARRRDVAILPGISPFIGDTEAEAHALERELNELTVPEYGLRQLGSSPGCGSPRPRSTARAGGAASATRGHQRQPEPLHLVAGIVARERPTVRRLMPGSAAAAATGSFAGTAGADRGHHRGVVPRAAPPTGSTSCRPSFPAGWSDFVDPVVPLLRERGLFRDGVHRDHAARAPGARPAPQPFRGRSGRRMSTGQCDVLVIGGGPAGTWAALKAAKAGASVVLADKGYCGTSGATAAAGTGVWYVPPDPAARASGRGEPGGARRPPRRPAAGWTGCSTETWERVDELATAGRYPFPRRRRRAGRCAPACRARSTCGACATGSPRAGVRILDHSPVTRAAARRAGAVSRAPRACRRQHRTSPGMRFAPARSCSPPAAARSSAGPLGCNVDTGDGALFAAEAGARAVRHGVLQRLRHRPGRAPR